MKYKYSRKYIQNKIANIKLPWNSKHGNYGLGLALAIVLYDLMETKKPEKYHEKEVEKCECKRNPGSFIPVLDVKKPVCLDCGKKLGEFEYHDCHPTEQHLIEPEEYRESEIKSLRRRIEKLEKLTITLTPTPKGLDKSN